MNYLWLILLLCHCGNGNGSCGNCGKKKECCHQTQHCCHQHQTTECCCQESKPVYQPEHECCREEMRPPMMTKPMEYPGVGCCCED